MNRSRLKLLSVTFALILPMRAFAAENSYSKDAAAAANKAYEARLSSEAGNSSVHAITLRDLFDPVYYAFSNPAAVTEAGNDPEALYYHFITKGIHQGYLCNSYFNILRYRLDHPELEELLGDNWDMWVQSFFKGISGLTSLRAMFDPVFYAASHPEVAIQYGTDPEALYHHYINFGLMNGYTGNPYFDVFSYFTAHPELMNVYGYNWDAWIADFYTRGISGGAETEGNTNDRLKHYTEDGDSDSSESITDGKGNILIPIEEVIRYHTLDELREKCGDSLVLITDKNGYVTFVGGHFTDVLVSDENDSIKAIGCMLELIGFPEGKILRFSQSVEDSIGNVYYQFIEADSNTGSINKLSVISLGVDDGGKVISLSSNCGAKIKDGYENDDPVSIEEIKEYLKSRNQTLVSEELKTIYSAARNKYCEVFYGRDEYGYIFEYLTDEKDDNRQLGYGMEYICAGKYSEYPANKNREYAFSYLFSDEVKTEDHVFKDYFGNDVTLSVASFIRGGEKYYYIVDKERKIAANVQNSFFNDYFNKGFESLDDVHSYYVQSMVNVQKTYDFYKDLGFIDQYSNIPFIISFIEDNTYDNAACSYNGGFFDIAVLNNKGNASFDVMAHEIGHAVLLSLAPSTNHIFDGSVHEGYADITGNLLEMLYYLAGENIGNVDLDNWPIKESTDSTLRSMGEPEKFNGASRVGGENYLITNIDSLNSHAHATILGNICYRMNKELNIPLDDLFRIWYDSMPNVTSRSTYKDIQGFIEYSTMLHGYPELVDEVSKLFEDANVDGYSDNWLTLQPADDYVTYVPAVIDGYSDFYKRYYENTNKTIRIRDWGNESHAWTDRYGNIGALVKKGDIMPEYNMIRIEYGSFFSEFRIHLSDSEDQTHFNIDDIMSGLYSRNGKPDDIDGFISVNYELNDFHHDYNIYRIYEEDGKHGYIYVYLVQNDDIGLVLCDDAKYGICWINDNGENEIVYTFNSSDLKDIENPVIKLTEDLNSISGVNVELISGSSAENSTAHKQLLSDAPKYASANYAASKSADTTTENKPESDEETEYSENSETNDGLRDTTESDSSNVDEENNTKDSSDETLSEGENIETSEGSTAPAESRNSDTEEERDSEDSFGETLSEGENIETSEGSTASAESGNSDTEEERDSKDSSNESSSEDEKGVTDSEINSDDTESGEEKASDEDSTDDDSDSDSDNADINTSI